MPLATSSNLDQSRAWINIDLAALQANVERIRAHLQPGTDFWAVVKANGYGHGVGLIAPVLLEAGVAGFCVATLPEGIELRQHRILAPILILGPLNTQAELNYALDWHLNVTLTHVQQIPMYQEVAHTRSSAIPIHLNVDTGMTRLGIPWSQAPEVWMKLVQDPKFTCCSVYSHLATADELDSPMLAVQQDRFKHILTAIQLRGGSTPVVHLDNSAGALVSLDSHYPRVRVGLAMYGISPAEHLSLQGQLQPVLSLNARITHLQTVEAGIGISYGHRYITPSPRHIATVGIGYADGIPRRLSGWLQGRLRDQTIQQVGTITMDQCMWDVTSVSNVTVGDVVELVGGSLSVQQWADYLGTIPYEILCGFSPRLPRIGCKVGETEDTTMDWEQVV